MGRHREHELQKACVTWFRYQYPKLSKLLFAVPNGAALRGALVQRAKQWKRLEAEGAVPGVSDLILLVPSGEFHGLCIEMKTKSKKSKQTDNQLVFEEKVIEQGYGYVVPTSVDEFIKIVTDYLEKGEC